MHYQIVGLVTLALWIFCLFDVITTPDGAARNLPKIVWVIIVLLFPLVGSIIWLVAGRPQGGPPRSAHQERMAGRYPEYDRPGRFEATNPDDDEEFLRRLRERAEEQRRNAPKKQDDQD